MRMGIPRRPRRPRRRPTGTFQRLGLTRAELQKQKLTATPARPTATPAGPTAAQKAKLVATLKAAKEKKGVRTAKPDPRIRKKPTGIAEPQKLKPGATAPKRLPPRIRKKPTGTPRRRMI